MIYTKNSIFNIKFIIIMMMLGLMCALALKKTRSIRDIFEAELLVTSQVMQHSIKNALLKNNSALYEKQE